MKAPETRNFIYNLQNQPEKVATAVGSVLRQETADVSQRETIIVLNSTAWSINYSRARNLTPSWMHVGGIPRMASEVTSSPVWNSLLSNVNPNMYKSISTELDSETPEIRLATANAAFATSAISLGLLAAASGNLIGVCIQEDRNPLNTEFALQIGNRYMNYPEDIDDYMTRVSELISDPDIADSKGPGTLLHYFAEYDAFKAPRSSDRCPATFLTQLALEEMGRQLHNNDNYRQRFKSSITATSETTNS